MIHVSVAQSNELQVELISLLSKYSDDDTTVKWAIRYAIPHDRLPHYIVPFVQSIDKEQQKW